MFSLFKSANPVREIAAAEVKRMLDAHEGFILLDVRSPQEYRTKHIPGSRSLPLDRLAKDAAAILTDPALPIVTYCQAGGRSARAAKLLTQLGYRNVANLGGINSWPYETEPGDG